MVSLVCAKVMFLLPQRLWEGKILLIRLFERSVLILYKGEMHTHTHTPVIILCPGTVWWCILFQQLLPCSHTEISAEIQRDAVIWKNLIHTKSTGLVCRNIVIHLHLFPFSILFSVCVCVREIVFVSHLPPQVELVVTFQNFSFPERTTPLSSQTQACEPADDALALEAGGCWWRRAEPR